MEQLYRTPLFEEHVALKAKMAPFDIWEMPIQYSGIIDEWGACRKSAAVFDTCHMGEFRMKGDIADSGIEDAVTLSVGTIPVGKSRYGFLLNDDGGVIDDLIVYRIANDELMIVVNAGTIDNDFKVIQSRLSSGVIFTNESEKTAKLDVQGPLSRDVMMETLGIPVKDLKYFQFFETKALDVPAIVSRTGYTGELGYEIYIERSQVVELWRRLLSDARVKPAGLGARDILRLEMGYSLYGNDLDEEISPLEAGLQMFVDYKKDFYGKIALLNRQIKGLQSTKVAFRTHSRRSPRSHQTIEVDGQNVGEVRSGTFSPALNEGIGMGYVKPKCSAVGTKIVLVGENVRIDAEIVELPFYKDGSARI